MAIKLTERRMALDKMLRAIVKKRCGAENVYYQPPTGLKMKYPCICYERDRIENSYASDKVYRQTVGYTITVIDTKADSEMTEAVSALEKCSFSRKFVSDNLYHDVFAVWN